MATKKTGNVVDVAHTMPRKYLITWNLTLGHDELTKISSRPQALDKALKYVREVAKKNEIEIYRFVPMRELSHHERPMAAKTESMQSSGIAIAKASSMEDAGRMIQEWVTGLSYGGIPIGNYLDYEIKPLAEIARGGG